MLDALRAVLLDRWRQSPDMRLSQLLAIVTYELFGTTDLATIMLVKDEEFEERLRHFPL